MSPHSNRTYSSWGSGRPGGYNPEYSSFNFQPEAGYRRSVQDWDDGFNGDPWSSWNTNPWDRRRRYSSRDYARDWESSAYGERALPGEHSHPSTMYPRHRRGYGGGGGYYGDGGWW